MKISEVELLKIKQGLRFKSIDGTTTGTVIAVDYLDDYLVYFIWDNEKEVNNWFGNDCDCEVIIEDEKFKYDVKNVKKEYLTRQEDFNKSLLKFVGKKVKDKNSKFSGLKNSDSDNEKLIKILEEMF